MNTTPTTDTQKNKRKKPTFRVNTRPLTERAAFELPDAADYLSLSNTTVRRCINRGLIERRQFGG
jgi:hypothetical protein